jgi:hypothetical protein
VDNSWCPSFSQNPKPKSPNHHNTLEKVKGRSKKWTILGDQVFHKTLNPNPQIIIIPCKTLCLLGQCKTMWCACEFRVNVNDLYLHIQTFYTYIISKYNFILFAMDHLLAYHPKHNKISSSPPQVESHF